MILVIDNFIKDKSLLNRIAGDITFFSDPGVYYWYPGWWSEDANTVKKELIELIWGEQCPINKSYNISGFEYWTGIQSANDSNFKNNLGMHIDKDESHFEKTGELVTPIIGTIYYPEQEEFEGGMLEIYTNGTDQAPERIYAKPNRLIIFGAGDVHHRVDTVISGTRKAIAINLWDSAPSDATNNKFKREVVPIMRPVKPISNQGTIG
jgi:hypothetical protein